MQTHIYICKHTHTYTNTVSDSRTHAKQNKTHILTHILRACCLSQQAAARCLNSSQETTAACSSSLAPEEQPQCIALSFDPG